MLQISFTQNINKALGIKLHVGYNLPLSTVNKFRIKEKGSSTRTLPANDSSLSYPTQIINDIWSTLIVNKWQAGLSIVFN
ncbi:hypothetical protein AGMMS49574_03010 [Bacteroidia bacterium]|nr:hypothetical protein AGMMS49574_03010 [Bacteroidia bacterium]